MNIFCYFSQSYLYYVFLMYIPQVLMPVSSVKKKTCNNNKIISYFTRLFLRLKLFKNVLSLSYVKTVFVLFKTVKTKTC